MGALAALSLVADGRSDGFGLRVPDRMRGVTHVSENGENLALTLSTGAPLPAAQGWLGARLLGFLGYGVSLTLLIVALRHLGAARTGAYFSVAPFFGAALALALLGERPDASFWAAAALMALGLWLHLGERHQHEHEHVHDAHHQHAHDFDWDGREPHVHPHRHTRLIHAHPHYPDLHHRHTH